MKEQFDQTMCALSPSLTTPPQFPRSPLGVPRLAPVAGERKGQNVLLGTPQLRSVEADLLHKVFSGRNGVTKDDFIQTHGEQLGDRKFVAALSEFIVRHRVGGAMRMLDFGQFDFTIRLRPAGRSRNWPKSKLAEVELAEVEKKKKLAEVEIGRSRSRSQPSPERKRVQAWCLTLHANNELSCLPLQVFGRLGASWHVDSSCFSSDCM